MSDLIIRIQDRAGRITLNRPKALNALTYGMIQQITATLTEWRNDGAVDLVIFDAAGDKAFCAGGDIADLYSAGKKGDFAFGQTFWRDEYRMNALIAEYPKPVVSFMQGFTMGGGVGVGCHAGWRIVGESSQIAMPECGIGLVPDVGGSLILAQAPGRIGEFLGLTGARMDAGDAIYAGFADLFIPEQHWEATIELLTKGDIDPLEKATTQAPPSQLREQRDAIDALFSTDTLADIAGTLAKSNSETAAKALKMLSRNSPLSMASALTLLADIRKTPTIHNALAHEYCFTARATEHGDFIEGIRAAIIDKDRKPVWKHGLTDVSPQDVAAMMAPLGDLDLTWKDIS